MKPKFLLILLINIGNMSYVIYPRLPIHTRTYCMFCAIAAGFPSAPQSSVIKIWQMHMIEIFYCPILFIFIFP